MNNTMYFGRGAELVNCLKWVSETQKEKNLPTGSPLTFTLLKQVTPTTAVAIACGKEGSWLCYQCEATGVVGTEYLLRAEDVVARQGATEVFKNYPLILSTTKKQVAAFKSVLEMNNKDADEGTTQVATYAGDLADFVVPTIEWQNVANLTNGWEFRIASRYNQDLSELQKGNTTDESPPCLLRFQDGKLSIASAEKGGSLNGTNSIVTEIPCMFSKPFRIAIRGRYLSKIAEVFDNQNTTIRIHLDNVEEPTRVKFEGSMGYLDVPTIPLYNCTALSEGAMLYFYGENRRGMEQVSTRHFLSDGLKGFVELQQPKDSNPDILLEMEKNKMIVSKRDTNLKGEKSKISTWGLEGEGEWTPYVIKHDLLMKSLETIDKFIKAKIDEAAKGFIPTDFDSAEPPQEFSVVELRQALVKVGRKEVNVLYVESPTYKDCRIMLVCNTLTKTADKAE